MITDAVVLVLSCLGVVQALFLCGYLFTVKDRRSNILLALVLLGLTLRIGKSVLYNYIPLEPWMRNLAMAGILMTGPFLWFYGKAIFEKKYFSGNDYLHLIPFAVFVLCCRIIPNRGDLATNIVFSLLFVHMAVYLGVCWVYIVRDLKGVRLLAWYRNITTGVTLIWLLYVGIFARIIPFYIIGAVFFSFLMYIFSYLLLKRHVFTLEKYASSGLDTVASRRLLEQIKALVDAKEMYLDSEMSLKMIAERLSVAARDVSQVINEFEQENFAEFVNQYRIARAKKLLTAPGYAREKIETIAYDCGFGNVTSFNLAFKAEMQMTPSQYRNQFAVAEV
jgi:AraC-like DNA-binding protein